MKKTIAWSLLLIGMSGAALSAARLGEDAVVADLLTDIPFWLGMVAVLAAIILNQKGHGPKSSKSSGSDNVAADIGGTIDEILTRIKKVDCSSPSSECVSELATVQESMVFSVTNAKDRLIAAKGFAFYAHFMSDFAVAERFLARAWSAAVDGYPEESTTYLKKAATFFDHSKQILEE